MPKKRTPIPQVEDLSFGEPAHFAWEVVIYGNVPVELAQSDDAVDIQLWMALRNVDPSEVGIDMRTIGDAE